MLIADDMGLGKTLMYVCMYVCMYVVLLIKKKNNIHIEKVN